MLQLAGLHSNAYINDLFARSFATEGMKAYVELIQRKEREIGCDVLTHQRVRPPASSSAEHNTHFFLPCSGAAPRSATRNDPSRRNAMPFGLSGVPSGLVPV